MDRFRISLRRRDQPDVTLALTLERRGLFAWKLIRIDIPQSLFTPTPSDTTVSAADAASALAPENTARAVPSDESISSASSGSELCRVVALVRVPAVEDPKSALGAGEIESEVTQYRVSKKTGVGVFCSHGGYCYRRFVSIGGKMTEALQLQKCRIGAKNYEDTEEIFYDVDLDRSQNSQADLQYNDLTNTLLSMGLCSACADNAAQFYRQRPTSECGLLVKSALEGDPASKARLVEFPDYCHWAY